MLDLLFVYGTLMRGYDHPMSRLLIRHYPGLVLSDAAADVAYGELYRLREPDALLREFDMYEACGEGFAEPTEYVRRVLPVTRAGGGTTEAWTYVYNWQVDNLPRIESGRFQKP